MELYELFHEIEQYVTTLSDTIGQFKKLPEKERPEILKLITAKELLAIKIFQKMSA